MIFSDCLTTPLVMQASTFGACPKPGQSERVAAGRASGVKWGMMEIGC